MAKPRLPQDKAEVSGAMIKNAGRFEGRAKPKGTRPLGEPYKKMTAEQREYWEEFRSDLPWLNSSHRGLLKLACILSARTDEPDCGIEAMRALSAIHSKLGATPVDETKVAYDPGEESDPAEAFFTRTH